MKRYIVLVGALMITFLLVIIGVINSEGLSVFSEYLLNDLIGGYFGWYYMLVAFFIVVICLYTAFSKYGSIKLGKDSDRPEFNKFTWIAMLYSAGLAISLYFWGVAEPVLMYMEPAVGEGETKEAADLAMQYSFFHWALHSFGAYTITGLFMAYFQYRKNAPPLINYAFQPLLGDRIHGPIGQIINIIAIFAVIGGITTSLGLGVMQMGAGFDYAWGIDNTPTTQIFMILILTVLFIISASSGIQRGIKWLSNINIVIALTVLVLIFILGPTTNILETFVSTTGNYLQNFINMSFHMEPFIEGYDWQAGWDFFYWGWAISFGVFVGLFMARISKGRTIKEFILGAMVVPSIATMVWYSTFGGSALYNIVNLGNNELANQILADMDTALFYFLDLFPLGSIIIVLVLVSLVIFFVTSADSTVYVLGMYSEGTTTPTNRSKILWGMVIAGLAIALLLSGTLTALQSISAAAGLPFSLIVIGMCVSFFKSLREEYVGLSYKKEK
ncbi:BCCT family transporter [Natribacillus halophilus]|uniref:Glycine betaine transporter n=1 Tax=Natribacillus halophilus TaxID=549003 RepID=A0A1G8P3J2_9BACI|nr:BCCT family transporter [Natribacillus halophilus]SDI86836.1 glycine betaine transporter [Natribacillus halophilus]